MSATPQNLRLNRRVPFVDAVFQTLEGTASKDKAIAILRAAERESGTQIFKPTLDNVFDFHSPARYKTIIQGNFFSFLNETHLVLCPAGEYDNVTLLFPDGFTWTATWRAWGAILAEWANQASWCDYNEWTYVDFYMGSAFSFIDQYEEWLEVALQIVSAKSQQ